MRVRTLKARATALLLSAAGLLWAADCAHAQTSNSTPARRLTLQEAMERANRQNLDLIAVRLRHAVAQAGVRIAGQLPNPTFNFSAARDTPHEGVFFDQPLEFGGKRHRRVQFAQEQVTLADVEIDAFARQIRRRVRAAYFAAAHARSFIAQRAQALEVARRVGEIAQARFEAGDVPQLEVLQADLEVRRADAELAVARQQEKVAFSRLDALLNEPADALWELTGALETQSPEIALPEMIIRAEAMNPDLQRLAQEKRVEESRRGLLSAERNPTLTVQFGADFNSPPDFRTGARGQLSFNLPIFSRNQGELSQSAASLQMITSETAAERRAVAGRVEAAYYEWAAREIQAKLYRETLVPVAEKLEGLAEESYRAGRANILTVLDAQRNVQQVRREYLDSLVALQTAFADLEETVGAPIG
jgi:cobalt-zinc-cadmium efflux system outer membrane protein